MPGDTPSSDRHVAAEPNGDVVRFHRRHAILQTVIFAVIVGIFLALIIRENKHHEQEHAKGILKSFTNEADSIEEIFNHLKAEILEIEISATEELAESRHTGLAMPRAFRFLQDTPDSKAFHLDTLPPFLRRNETGNLTGDGSIRNRSPEFYREVAMALKLGDDFQALASSIPELTWIYYYSKNNFALYYPWVLSGKTRFEKEAFKSTAWTLGLPENNPERRPYWTEVYFDAVGKGLMTSCLMPIYDNDNFLGVVGGDLSVDFLNKMLADFKPDPEGKIYLYDSFDNLVAGPGLVCSSDMHITKLKDSLPDALARSRNQLAIVPRDTSTVINDWRVQRRNLGKLPFEILYIVPVPSTASALTGRYRVASLLICALMLLLMSSLLLNHTRFIRPSAMFVRHIMRKSKGEESDLDQRVPQVWRRWFQKITLVFDRNAELTDELQAKNRELQKETLEHKRAEEMLDYSERRSRALLQHSPVWHKIVDLDFNLQYMSPAGLAALKIEDESQVYGKPYPFDFYPESFRNEMTRNLEKARESGEVITQEASVVDLDGNELWFHSTLVPVFGDDGRMDYIVVVSADTTERKLMEAQLRQTEKMNAIGQLAGGIAHDFNNQLTGILGYADMLERNLKDEKLSGYATNIIKSANCAADLTAQLLAFSRKGKNLSVPVEIHKVLAEVNSILEHSIDKRIKIQQHLKANPSTTIGDPTQLQNAILNMALNARDAMPEGGEIVFETDRAELDEHYCNTHPYEITPGSYLKISITDNGCGMDAETRKHIFEPFYTTKEVGKGTGMGLAGAYGTIRNHGGAISVYSEVGHGTTFRIYLPLGEDARDLQDASDKSAIITGTARILLVDDEEMIRKIAADMLKDLGYEVTSCRDGREAVEYYRESWKNTDLVILDMVMPELGGRDTFAAMRKINPDIKAILSSGYSINGEAQSILDDGVKAFVGKPYKQTELSETVAQVLSGTLPTDD